jgi:hypothetical protein
MISAANEPARTTSITPMIAPAAIHATVRPRSAPSEPIAASRSPRARR